MDSNEKVLGNLFVAFALGYKGKDGAFALGQAGEGGCACIGGDGITLAGDARHCGLSQFLFDKRQALEGLYLVAL
jgi:hypothetical protein